MKWIGQIVNDVKVNFSNDGEIYVIGDDLYIENVTQDKDIIFKTNDGGTATEVMRIDGSTSRVGIGTSNPSYSLDVASTGSTTLRLTSAGTGAVAMRYENAAGFKSGIVVDNNGTYRVDATNIYLNPTNNVGIGTTSPESLLTIKGDALTTSQPVRITNSVQDTHTALFINNLGNTIGEKYGLQFGGYNEYSIGGIFGVLDSTSGSTSGDITIDFANGTSAGDLIEKVRFTHEGNVGIGTASPSANLQLGSFGAANQEFRIESAGNSYFSILTTNGVQKIYAGGAGTQSNEMAFYTSSSGTESERVRIDNSGNVGIGTTSPSDKLDVQGGYLRVGYSGGAQMKILPHSSNDGYGFYDVNNANADMWFKDGNVGIGTGLGSTPSAKLEIAGSGNQKLLVNRTDGDNFYIDAQNGQIRMRGSDDIHMGVSGDLLSITNSNIGIGTTSPTHKLTINSTNNTTAFGIDFPSAHFDFSANSTSGYTSNFRINDVGMDIGHDSTSRALNLQTGNADRLTILGTGNVGIGTTSPSEKLHVVGDSLVTGDNQADTFKPAAIGEPIKFKNFGSTELVRITDGGNVLIGTTTDSGAKLQVTDSASNDPIIEISNSDNGGVSPSLTINGTNTASSAIIDLNRTNVGRTSAIRYLTNGTLDWHSGVFYNGGASQSNYGVGTDRNLSDQKLIITSGGNIGIGTTSPASLLHVAGTVQVGVDDTGHDVIFYGATSGRYMMWDESSDRLEFTDNAKIYLGNGSDLQIYHTGSNSNIKHDGTGALIITQATDDQDIILKCDDGSGGETAYLTLDGSEGYTVANKNIRFQDNIEARFGSGNDMKLFHTGAYSMIQNLTGDLFIQNVADDKDIIFQSDDGSGGVETYFFLDGSLSSGNPFTVFPDNARLALGSSTDMYMYHNGTNTTINNDTGDLYIKNSANDKDIIFQCDDGSGSTETYFKLDGSVSSGNPWTVFPDQSRLGFGAGLDLRFYHDGTNSYVENEGGNLYIRNDADDKDIIFQSDDGTGGAATYLTLDGSATRTAVHKDLRFDDNIGAVFGSGAALKLHSDGSNGLIDNYQGNLIIRQQVDDADIVFQGDDGSGGVETYFYLDGSVGGSVPYTVFPDNARCSFGNPGDGTFMELFHDGTNSYIENESGDFYIKNNADDKDIIFQSDDGSGSVETYFFLDGSAGGSNPRTVFPDDSRLCLGSGHDLKIFNNGSDSFVSQETDGDLYIRNIYEDKDVIFQSDDGSGGETAYLTLDGSAAETKVDKDMRFGDNVNLRIGTNSDVVIVHDNSNFTTTNYTGNYNIINQQVDGDIVFQTDDGSGGVETYLTIDGGSQEIIATKPIVTGETQIKVLPHHFMSNEDGGANKSAQFRDDTIIGVRTSADSAELYAFVDIPYGKTATNVTVYGNDTNLTVNVYESDINAGALTDKTPEAGCRVGAACDITDVAYSATNYLAIKVTTTSYTNDIVYGAVVTIT